MDPVGSAHRTKIQNMQNVESESNLQSKKSYNSRNLFWKLSSFEDQRQQWFPKLL